jgi:hypothetical protein
VDSQAVGTALESSGRGYWVRMKRIACTYRVHQMTMVALADIDEEVVGVHGRGQVHAVGENREMQQLN